MAEGRYDNLFETLAQNLRDQRKKKGLSQEDLAALAHLDRTYISLIETGKRNPSLSTIADLAQILQIPLTNLLLEKTNQEDAIMQFCAEYSINPSALVDILRDPKVIPMVRGKAFEFAVQEKLAATLSPSYTITNPYLNPQSGTDKTDVQIIRTLTNQVFRVECKLTQKGEFKALPGQGGYRLRVKCMRSRTLGEEAATRMSAKTGRSAQDHFVHGDQYLPQEFDFVVTSIANSFFETNEEGAFVWQPPATANAFLANLKVRNPNDAFHRIYVARSTDLAALPENLASCNRQICDNKTGCGFIPNYPMVFFDNHANVQRPWYPIEELEALLR